jgi:hypothetical protein
MEIKTEVKERKRSGDAGVISAARLKDLGTDYRLISPVDGNESNRVLC